MVEGGGRVVGVTAVARLLTEYLSEAGRQPDVGNITGFGEEQSDLFGAEAGNPTSDFGDEEAVLGVKPGERDELVDVGAYGFDTALHGGDGVGFSLQTDALAPDGSEVFEGESGSASGVAAGEVAPEDEDFAGVQCRNTVGSDPLVGEFVFHGIGAFFTLSRLWFVC